MQPSAAQTNEDFSGTGVGMLGLHMARDENREIVEFKEDGVVEILEQEIVSPMNDYLRGAEDTLENDIHGFLKRPVEITNFQWPATAIAGTDLIDPNVNIPGISLPFDWIERPMINQKLQGFTFLRCDFRVRVQVNAQPFNAGRLLVWFEPLTSNMETHLTQATSTRHFGGITGYRHIDLDLSETTAVEFTVPYIGLLSHFNLITREAFLGKVRLTVYSQLTAGETGAEVDGTVWINAENIDLQMPTGLPLSISPALRRVKAQIAAEKKAAAKGNVETIANSVSSIASKIGKIPGLSEVSNGVSWVSDAVSGIASIFGWSKPTDPNFTTIVQPTFNRHMTNYNGDSKSKPLGLDARNEICIPQHSFCSTEDEMSLAHITQKITYADRFNMDTTMVANQFIWRWPVTPSACVKNISTGPPQEVVAQSTMLSYVSNLFKFWRGGINYHFKIIKTNFHSGRIRVSFVPQALLTTDPSTIDIDKCYSKIYDLRDTTAFEFEIPFVFNALWQDLGAPIDTINPSALSYDAPTGMIYVEILNQLKNPSTTASHIEFIVETSAAEDFQFAFLTQGSKFNPVRRFIPSSPERPVRFALYNDQPEEMVKMNCKKVAAQICDTFFNANKMRDFNPNLLGMGEAITSLRQILKRSAKLGTLPAVVAGSVNVIRPLVTNSSWVAQPEGAGVADGIFDYISNLFRLQSGGMRLLFVSDFSVSHTTVIARTHSNSNYTGAPTSFFTVDSITSWPKDTSSLPLVYMFPFTENTLEIDIPFYQEIPVIMTDVGSPVYESLNHADALNPTNGGTEIALNNTDPLEVFRSIGEDFSFGYSIGPPLTSALLV